MSPSYLRQDGAKRDVGSRGVVWCRVGPDDPEVRSITHPSFRLPDVVRTHLIPVPRVEVFLKTEKGPTLPLSVGVMGGR